jgi:hypothetical protein
MTPAQLRRLLADAGLSQCGAARELDIADRTMRRYIAGELPVPKVVTLALAEVMRRTPPTAITFDRSWRRNSTIRPATLAECHQFIDAHYLRKRPAITLLCLLAERDGAAFGCVVYSAPPREIEKRYGGKTWELARLYLLDAIPRNAETWLIGRSIRYIKQNHANVRHLVSYADPSAGHSGHVYKASNWIEDGRMDDERKNPRNDKLDTNTGRRYSRWSAAPSGSIKVPRVSKFRFVYRL